MKRLILHIGCEKTGSTSIQNFLYTNRHILLEKNQVLYPKSLGGRNHTKLAIYSCDPNKQLIRFIPKGQTLTKFRAKVQDDFRREINESLATTFIISNEWLHPRIQGENEFRRLKNLFGDLFEEIKVVLYIRPQDKLALSLYSTALKAGSNKKFSFPKINPNKLPYYFDFYTIYKNWALAFGEDNIIVKMFDRKTLLGGDVVKDFLSVIKIDSAGLEFPKQENLSLSDSGIKLMRAINLIEKKSPMSLRPVFSRLKRATSQVFSGTPHLATDNECEAFMEKFAESNQSLADRLSTRSGAEINVFGYKGEARAFAENSNVTIRLGFIKDVNVLVSDQESESLIINLYPLSLRTNWNSAKRELVDALQDAEKKLTYKDNINTSVEWLYIDIRNSSDFITYDEKLDFIVNQSVMEFTAYFRNKGSLFKHRPFDKSFYGCVENWENKLYLRYGIVELRALYSYIYRRGAIPEVMNKIIENLHDSEFMCSDRFQGGFLSAADTEYNIKRLWVNAGFYSSKNNPLQNLDDFDAWAEHYLAGLHDADNLFRCPGVYINFLPIEFFLKRRSGIFKNYIVPPPPEQFYEMLENRKVLVVSPFAEQLNDSFVHGKMHRLYKDLELPEFDFKAIQAPMTIYPNREGQGWSETFEVMCKKIIETHEDYSFDLFFASAGCYGIPLCRAVHNHLEVSSVYLGNRINTLFGIDQNTSKGFMDGRKNTENWSSSHLSKIPGLSRIDNGRYI